MFTSGFLTKLLKFKRRLPVVCGFLDCFSITDSFATFCRFHDVRLNSLNAGLNFRSNKSNFCRLDALVCGCSAIQ